MVDNSFQNELYVPSKEPWTTFTPSSAFDTRQKAVENRTTFDNIVSHYPPLTGCTCAARLKSATPLSGGRGARRKSIEALLLLPLDYKRCFHVNTRPLGRGFSRGCRGNSHVCFYLHKGATSYVHPSRKACRCEIEFMGLLNDTFSPTFVLLAKLSSFRQIQ